MLRKLGWLAVGLFVIADVVLITLALQHTRPDHAGSGPMTVTVTTRAEATSTPTSTPTSDLTAAQTGPAVSPPTESHAKQTRPPSSTSVTTVPPSSTSVTTVPTSSASPSASVTALTPVPPEDRLLLDMSSDGHVVRAIRGRCPSPAPTTIEVSGDGGATWSTVDTNTPVVLRIGARRGGHLWYVGTDASCSPLDQDTSDGGTTWTPGSTDGTWFFDPDPTSHTVHSPTSAVDAGCPPRTLAGIDLTHAVIACDNGDIRTTADAGATWSTASHLPGVVSLSFISVNDGYALAPTDGCAAQVLGTTTAGATWQDLTCLAGTRPRGIAAAADQIVAQVGESLYSSGDEGATWSAVG